MLLQEEGLIRHIGLTNFDAVHLRALCEEGFKIVSNQVWRLSVRTNNSMRIACIAEVTYYAFLL